MVPQSLWHHAKQTAIEHTHAQAEAHSITALKLSLSVALLMTLVCRSAAAFQQLLCRLAFACHSQQESVAHGITTFQLPGH